MHSRLIGQRVNIRLYAEHLEIWYAQRCVDHFPRLRGQGKHRVQYAHVIDSLIRKPGAFQDYRYREDMFPTSRFRRAYDGMQQRHTPRVAARQYLQILKLAVAEGESVVDQALIGLETGEQPITSEAVRQQLGESGDHPQVQEIRISQMDVGLYDQLLEVQHV